MLARARIYLTGRVSLEGGAVLVDERHLAGRQGRLAFVRLAIERHQPVSRDRLVSAIWSDAPPREVDIAVGAILSKLRTAIKKTGLSEREAGIDVRLGSITLRLPMDVWVDLEEAANAIDEAEGMWRAGDHIRAWGGASVAVSIARRPFLANEEAPWIEAQRATLRLLLTRGLQCLSAVSAVNGESSLAIQYATEVIELEPFRETAYQQLMRLHAQMGNRAEALRVFGRCRELLREELGASPSPETEALFLQILRDTG
jgi:DNA-binding SARP family transcriptional activator